MALSAAVTVISAVLVTAPAVSLVAAPPASAATVTTVCPADRGASPAVYPEVHRGPVVSDSDSGPTVLVGGNFLASTGSAEGEGRLVVDGSATFSTGYYNLGVVGIGSQVTPPALSDMLVAGGPVSVTSGDLEVGYRIGGNIVSGGTVTAAAPSTIATNGGSTTENLTGATAPYAAVADGYRALSRSYAAMPTTGTTTWDADSVTFTGDGTTSRQVFTIPGNELGSLGSTNTKSVDFVGIPLDTVIVVNVTGPTAMLSLNRIQRDGQWLDHSAPVTVDPTAAFARFAQAMMWNIPDATTVTLGDDDQLIGSVLVPTAGSATTMLTSTNGRIYAAGDLTVGGSAQTGLEFHNYRFAETSCTYETGNISISKTLADSDGVVGARLYSGGYQCALSGAVIASGRWALAAGSTFVTPDMREGAVCLVTEDPLTSAPSADTTYSWSAPTITAPAAVVGNATTPFVVHNQVRRAVGDLEMVKVLDDPFGVVDLSRLYSGSFSCLFNGVDVTPAHRTWRERAGAAPVRLATALPAGTVCTLAEDPVLVPPLPGFPQYHWARPVISPASVTIADNTLSRITVTNIVEDPFEVPATDVASENTVAAATPPRGATPPSGVAAVLAHTGADTAGPLIVAGFMILLGLAGLFARSLSRRQRHERR